MKGHHFRKLIIAVALAVLATTVNVALMQDFTDNNPGNADGNSFTRTVNVPNIGTIQDVNIAITFLKSNDPCGNAAGYAYNGEIYFRLQSPGGTVVNLVNAGTYSGGTYGGLVTVRLDDSAAALPSGMPTSGTFRPVQPLAGFNGQAGLGGWTLTIGDSAGGDPLCYQSYTLSLVFQGTQGSASIDFDAIYNPGDARINHAGKDRAAPVAIYCELEGINILIADPANGGHAMDGRGLYLSYVDAAAKGIPTKRNLLLKEEDGIQLWRLTTGEFQVNTTYVDGKPWIFVWDNCPPTKWYHLAN